MLMLCPPMIRYAVILAGGEGTRLRPVTLEIPKPLVPVQGVPIATWLVRLFARDGVDHITLIHSPKWKQAFEAWRSNLGTDIKVDLFEEQEPMGTMGALVHEVSLGDGPFFVTNGDELKAFDLARLTEAHVAARDASPSHAVTMALRVVPNPSDYGVADLQDGKIVHYIEKPVNPPSSCVNTGLYIVEPDALREAKADAKRFLMFEMDLFPKIAEQGRFAGCVLEGPWYDCGTLERWEKAIHEWPGFSFDKLRMKE